MNRKRIIIATMGDFNRYSGVNYKFDDSIEPIEEKEFHSKYGPAALAKAIGARKIIVLLPLSLLPVAHAVSSDGGFDIECLKRDALNFIEGEFSGYKSKPDIDLRIVVNNGEFIVDDSRRLRIDAPSGSVHISSYLGIIDALSGESEADLYVDTTHSINSVLIEAIDAVELSARTLVISGDKKFKLKYVSSEPYYKGAAELRYLEFKRESLLNNEKKTASSLSYIFSLVDSIIDENDLKRLLKLMDFNGGIDKTLLQSFDLFRKGEIFLTGIFHSFYEDIHRKITSFLKNKFLNYEKFLKRREGNLFIIGMHFNKNIPSGKFWIISAVLSYLSVLSSPELSFGEVISLEELKHRIEQIHLPDFQVLFLKNEIKKIREAVEDEYSNTSNKKTWNVLSQIISTQKPESNENHVISPCGFDQRNMRAHGGLERNITWLRIDEHGDILISYGNCLPILARDLLKFDDDTLREYHFV